jgi:hypothetical protein
MRTFALWAIPLMAYHLAAPTLAQAQISSQTAPTYRGDTGPEIGFRLGWAVPAGDATGDSRGLLSDRFAGVLPIVFDLGYRLHPRVYIGAYFQYGFGFVNDSPGSWAEPCGRTGSRCSISSVRWGGDIRVHLMPTRKIDPWLGTGIGHEKMTFDAYALDPYTGAQAETHWTASGLEYVHADVGAEHRGSRNVSIGAILSVSVGHYSNETNWYPLSGQRSPGGGTIAIPSGAVHEWIMFCVRVSYLIPV